MPKIGVVLSGCGHIDGGEIQETVLTLLYLDQAGAEIEMFAPSRSFEVVDHLVRKPTGEKRDVLREAARIARGKIRDLTEARAADMDGLILPGGSGLTKNLCDFAEKGPKAQALPELDRLIKDLHAAGKPIGAVCIAPVLLAICLGDKKPGLTIGADPGVAAVLASMGAVHHDRAVQDVYLDEANKLVTTPAYMLGPWIKDIAAGIEKLVAAVVAMAGK